MTAIAPPQNVANTVLLRWAFERLNAKDLASLRQILTDESVEHFPTGTCRGASEITAYFSGVFAALEDFSLQVIATAESGDDAFVHWRLTGRHVGRLVGVDGTGRDIDLEGIDHFVLRRGKVVSATVLYDQMLFARQIKMLPPDGSLLDRAMKTPFNAKAKAIAALTSPMRPLAF